MARTRTHEAAHVAYDRIDADIGAMLTELTALREAHRASFEESGSKNWGFAGDLGVVKERLADALRMMGSPDYQEE